MTTPIPTTPTMRTTSNLSQEEAIEILKFERRYQERTYSPHVVLPSGQTRAQRDAELPSHLVMLKTYVDQALNAWTKGNGSSFQSLREVAKVGAIALRALERVPEATRLWNEGIRNSDRGDTNPINALNSDPTGDF